MKNFTNITLNYKTIHNFYIRTKIFDSLKLAIPLFQGEFLDVGCGKMPYKNFILKHSKVENYVGLDIEEAIKYDESIRADLYWDGINIPVQENSFHSIMATEVLEHCPRPSVTLNEIYRVLQPEGVFFFTVPFLWNLHEAPHDEYRYTPFALKRLLKEAGFVNIKIEATGGWHASMAQMMGLWIKRSPMRIGLKKILSFFCIPLMKYLIKRDSKTPIEFNEGQMITGLSGTATK